VVAIDVDRPGLQPVHDPWSTAAWAVQDRDVARVWVDGRLVAEDGRALAVDPAELRALVDAATRRLVPGYGAASGD
jgi:5-methylthioadenosine/S-adenosylhomocysteine deaminase